MLEEEKRYPTILLEKTCELCGEYFKLTTSYFSRKHKCLNLPRFTMAGWNWIDTIVILQMIITPPLAIYLYLKGLWPFSLV